MCFTQPSSKIIVIGVVFTDKPHHRLYFPPAENETSTSTTSATSTAKTKETEAELEAEAEAVAHELPDAPTSDPADAGHAGKKQKHRE